MCLLHGRQKTGGQLQNHVGAGEQTYRVKQLRRLTVTVSLQQTTKLHTNCGPNFIQFAQRNVVFFSLQLQRVTSLDSLVAAHLKVRRIRSSLKLADMRDRTNI